MKPYLICYHMPKAYEQYYTVMATDPKHAREVFAKLVRGNALGEPQILSIYQQVD